MELIPIVDENDSIIGEEELIAAHDKGLLHRECAVYLLNSKKEVLLQLRTDNKKWDTSSAGHFSSKETYLEGALREFYEELGIRLDPKELEEIGYERMESYKTRKNIRFVKTYLVKKEIQKDNFKLDPKELIDVKYFNKKEISELMKDDSKITGGAKYLLNKYIISLM